MFVVIFSVVWAIVVILSTLYVPYLPSQLCIGALIVPVLFYARKRKNKYVRLAISIFTIMLATGAMVLYYFKLGDPVSILWVVIILWGFDYAMPEPKEEQ